MGIIICVFTFIPRQITRLNELAKEEHAYDKEYTIRHNHRSTSRTKTTWSFWSTWSWSFWSKTTTATTSITTGHVIVSGVDLSMEIVRDFLTEFYHPTRGNILLDVIFLSEKIPSKALIRFLQNEKYRDKTLYLRGTLTLQKDQKRVQLNHATAVFLLTKVKEFVSLQEKKQIDATLLLQALSVRNALSPPAHHHIDVYLQRLTFTSDKANLNNEEEEEEDMACFLLGANIMKIIPLQHAMLARASICPGTGVFLLNLIRSVDINVQYAKYRPFWNDSFSHTSSCVWLDEYIDGMSYQIYPIIFSKKFRGLLFEQVVEEIYRHYRAIVFALHVKNHMTHGTKLCPFGHVLQEG
jgi:potassium large conductance calcium-activated channel subfamily M alpha protein 1